MKILKINKDQRTLQSGSLNFDPKTGNRKRRQTNDQRRREKVGEKMSRTGRLWRCRRPAKRDWWSPLRGVPAPCSSSAPPASLWLFLLIFHLPAPLRMDSGQQSLATFAVDRVLEHEDEKRRVKKGKIWLMNSTTKIPGTSFLLLIVNISHFLWTFMHISFRLHTFSFPLETFKSWDIPIYPLSYRIPRIKIKEQQLCESVVVETCVGLLGVVWTNITHRRTPPDMTKWKCVRLPLAKSSSSPPPHNYYFNFSFGSLHSAGFPGVWRCCRKPGWPDGRILLATACNFASCVSFFIFQRFECHLANCKTGNGKRAKGDWPTR